VSGATRRSSLDAQRALRDRGRTAEGGSMPQRHPQVRPRAINVVWASIADGDLLPGELAYNDNDNSIVVREGNNIYRYLSDTTRAI